jgi:Trypsin-like serine proteases, typically periplasmic, contain C-terminal PDZ domain
MWGDSDSARVGDWTIAIGNPLGLGGTVTAGIVSAISRDIGNGPYVKFIQTDASINRGNSGGPLFNVEGELIGINSAIISQTGGSIGLGFAIPSNSAKKIVNQLKEFGRTKRGWLGVQITPVSQEIAESLNLPDQKGAFVSSLNPEGPSKKAGIQEGDVILEFNNIEIIKMIDLPRIVAESDVGSVAKVKVWRKDKKISIDVKLGELPEESYVDRKIINNVEEKISLIEDIGISIKPRKDKDIGVIVVSAEEGINLIPEDIILEINREEVLNVEYLIDLVREIKQTGRTSLLLKILRNSESKWVTIKF